MRVRIYILYVYIYVYIYNVLISVSMCKNTNITYVHICTYTYRGILLGLDEIRNGHDIVLFFWTKKYKTSVFRLLIFDVIIDTNNLFKRMVFIFLSLLLLFYLRPRASCWMSLLMPLLTHHPLFFALFLYTYIYMLHICYIITIWRGKKSLLSSCTHTYICYIYVI